MQALVYGLFCTGLSGHTGGQPENDHDQKKLNPDRHSEMGGGPEAYGNYEAKLLNCRQTGKVPIASLPPIAAKTQVSQTFETNTAKRRLPIMKVPVYRHYGSMQPNFRMADHPDNYPFF